MAQRDDRYDPSHPRHRELMLACCATGAHKRYCVLCNCEMVVELYGFPVCEYHRTHGEDDPLCPNCH
jgi:hypothetical protein